MSAVPPQSVQFGCPHCGCKLTIPAHSGPLEGPCPRCAKPIRAAAPAATKAQPQPPARPTAPSPQTKSVPSPPTTMIAQNQQVRVKPSPETAPPGQTLYCRCPSCGHHHAFAAKDLGQISQCSACHTTIRLPQKPQPEVPLQQDVALKNTVPVQAPVRKEVPVLRQAPEQTKQPQPVQSTLDSIVKALHDYEQSGLPSNHPDRLHLLEQFFAAFSTGEFNKRPLKKHQAYHEASSL